MKRKRIIKYDPKNRSKDTGNLSYDSRSTRKKSSIPEFSTEKSDASNLSRYESDIDGYSFNGFDENGIHRSTGTKFDTYGYDEDRFDMHGFNIKRYK